MVVATDEQTRTQRTTSPLAVSSGTQSQYFTQWIEAQPAGAYAYPVRQPDGTITNRLVYFSPAKNKRYARTVNSMVADGVSIPIVPEHTVKAVPVAASDADREKAMLAGTVGFVRGARVAGQSGTLELLVEVRDPVWIPKMGVTVLHCSPGFRDWYRTGDGKKWTDVVAHLALTHHPVDHHKSPIAPMLPVIATTTAATPASRPKAAGIAVLARDTGRVLMLQRANAFGDPAAGTWEFPGGHIEDGETPLAGAKREWSEETGGRIPRKGKRTGEWLSSNGVYQGFVWSIPCESDLEINIDPEDRRILNPDDPDGDNAETMAWWDVKQLAGNPAIRKELLGEIDKVCAAIRGQGGTPSGDFNVTFMSLTPAEGGTLSPRLVPIWEVPYSVASTQCLVSAGTSFIFKHSDGKQRFGTRKAGLDWLRSQYSKQFSLNIADVEANTIWMAVMHAPVGGVQLQGRFYRGGMFIPNSVVEGASPAEKAKIKDARAAHEAERTTNARDNMNDAESVHDAIIRHAGEHGTGDQTPDDKRDTLWRWDVLKAKHGEKGALEAVVTLAANEAKELKGLGGYNNDQSTRLKRRLAAYAAMVRFASDPGHVEDHKAGASAPAAKQPVEKVSRNGQEPKEQKNAENDQNAPSGEDVEPKTQSIAHLFDAGLASSDITSKMREKFGQTAKDVHARLSPAAKERFAKHVQTVSFHESPDVLTEKLIEANPKMKDVITGNKKAGGAYSKMRQELLLNGGHKMDGKTFQADHIYAHEFAHAIDGPDLELSKDEGWRAAWRAEAPLVSKYATKTPQEGFAEFGRLVYASGLHADQLNERYPKMMEHWGKLGLLPDGGGAAPASAPGEGGTQPAPQLASGRDPQLPDVFEEPIDTPDTIGDKALAKRATGESLKDYLGAIGGAGAHDTIRDYAKQLHEQDKAGVDEHNEVVRSAMSALTSHYGKGFTKAHPDLRKDDPAEIKGLDTVASELAGSYPHILGSGASYDGGDANDTVAASKAMDKLHSMLQEGIKSHPELRDYEDQAVQEWHDNGRPLPEGAESPENADTSFDFGANAESNVESSETPDRTGGSGTPSSKGSSKRGRPTRKPADKASEPPPPALENVADNADSDPFKPTPEESKAAWEKFAAVANAKGGLIIPPKPGEAGHTTAAGDVQRSEGSQVTEGRDNNALMRAKMEAEERRHAASKAATVPAPRKPKFNTETGERIVYEDEKPAPVPVPKSVATKSPQGDIHKAYADLNPDSTEAYNAKIAKPVLSKMAKGWVKAEDAGVGTKLHEGTTTASRIMKQMVDAGHGQIAWDAHGTPHYAAKGIAKPEHLFSDGEHPEEKKGKQASWSTLPDEAKSHFNDMVIEPLRRQVERLEEIGAKGNMVQASFKATSKGEKVGGDHDGSNGLKQWTDVAREEGHSDPEKLAEGNEEYKRLRDRLDYIRGYQDMDAVKSAEPTPAQIATGDFMKPKPTTSSDDPKRTTYSADDLDELAGQSFTNARGLTVDVVKDEDGTYSVGSKYGLSKQAAANHLNGIGAERAKGLFAPEVTAQTAAGGGTPKKQEKLEWSPPVKPKTEKEAELPGMAEPNAPGMFGVAKTENDTMKKEQGALEKRGDNEGGSDSSLTPPQRAMFVESVNRGSNKESNAKVLAALEAMTNDQKAELSQYVFGGMGSAKNRLSKVIDRMRSGKYAVPAINAEAGNEASEAARREQDNARYATKKKADEEAIAKRNQEIKEEARSAVSNLGIDPASISDSLLESLPKLATSDSVGYLMNVAKSGYDNFQNNYTDHDQTNIKAVAKKRLEQLGYPDPVMIFTKSKKGWNSKIVDRSEHKAWQDTPNRQMIEKDYKTEAKGELDDNGGGFTGGIHWHTHNVGDLIPEGVVRDMRIVQGDNEQKVEYLVGKHTKKSEAQQRADELRKELEFERRYRQTSGYLDQVTPERHAENVAKDNATAAEIKRLEMIVNGKEDSRNMSVITPMAIALGVGL